MKPLQKATTVNAKDKTILRRCAKAIKHLDPSSQVILYGSRARGDAQPDSDYDLLIVTEGEASLKREDLFRRRIYDIELETGAVLIIRLLNRATLESPLYQAMPIYQNVNREGVFT